MTRRAVAGAVVAVVLALGACGTSEPDNEPATPGANVDPASDNVITNPINRARSTADDAEARYEQLDQ